MHILKRRLLWYFLLGLNGAINSPPSVPETFKGNGFFFLLLVQFCKRALMKEIVHIFASLRGSMWEVSLEVQKTVELGLPAIPAVNLCVHVCV